MKIFNLGLEIEPGKHKYKTSCFDKLVEKFDPKKSVAYSAEFVDAEPERADAIVFAAAKRLDFILIDLDKVEKRLLRSQDQGEKDTLIKAQKMLEKETLLCDAGFSPQETEALKLLQLVTIKPSVEVESLDSLDELIKAVIEKSGIILFFTAGKKEVHAWSITKGENILEAAGKIHSDLKRGFIKGDVVEAKNLDNFFNMAEARSRGFVKVVDKDYVMQANDIIEIRFSV